MTGTGFIIFGIFVALFGYVLIACATSGRRHCTNRTMAEIKEIKCVSNLDLYKNFFKVIVTYAFNTESVISSFIVHSPFTYQPGNQIEILFNPKKPSQILSSNDSTNISPFFIIITALGIGFLIIGAILTMIGI